VPRARTPTATTSTAAYHQVNSGAAFSNWQRHRDSGFKRYKLRAFPREHCCYTSSARPLLDVFFMVGVRLVISPSSLRLLKLYLLRWRLLSLYTFIDKRAVYCLQGKSGAAHCTPAPYHRVMTRFLLTAHCKRRTAWASRSPAIFSHTGSTCTRSRILRASIRNERILPYYALYSGRRFLRFFLGRRRWRTVPWLRVCAGKHFTVPIGCMARAGETTNKRAIATTPVGGRRA